MTDEKQTLTLEDAVDAETLGQFAELQSTKQHLAMQLLSLEQQKIEIIRSANRLDDQCQRLYEAVLVARGESPNLLVEIDSTSGKITRLEADKPKTE